MSAIYFHQENGEDLAISGRERFMMGNLVNQFLFSALDISGEASNMQWLRSALRPSHYLLDLMDRDRSREFGENVRNAISASFEPLFELDGEPVNTFCLALNSAADMGSEPVRLLARLHAHCEMHGWIPHGERAGIATVIRDGLADGIMRPDMGWEALATELRSGTQGDVVTSYSVTDSFPHRKTWKASMVALESEPGLRITRKNLKTVRYGNCMNGFQFLRRVLASGEAAKERRSL